MAKKRKRHISFGTVIMLICTACVLAGFGLMLPSFTGNQDIFIDAARLAVAMDDSLSQLTELAEEKLTLAEMPMETIIPPFTASLDGLKAAATPSPYPTVSPKRSFTLCAAGSVELNSDVRKALTIDKTVRYDILTDQITDAMQAELSIATLQNTVSASNSLSGVNMSADLLTALRTAGINALSIANSNMLNFGEQGLLETAEAVSGAGMTTLGKGDCTRLSINGIEVALLHYQDRLSTTGRKQTTEEQQSRLLHPIDPARISEDIQTVRSEGAQVVIVTLCWGETERDIPTDEQKRIAQALADAGADIILGTGNGALQPVQMLTAQRGDQTYHPVLCAYSLGNLFSPDRETRVTLASLMLNTTVVYDTSTQTVAFDNLTYTPTYAWRGKQDNRTLQRILINDPANIPAFVDANQKGVMERCLTLVKDVMAETAIPLSY